MKCYNLEYDLSKRSGKTVYVSQNSTFQIGIKCKYGDTFPVVELYKGTEKLEPEGTIGSYRTWQLTSGEAKAEESYEAECMGVRLPLKVVTTCSTVAELAVGSADLSKYLTKEEAQSTYATQESVSKEVTSLDSRVTMTYDMANTAITDVNSAKSDIGKMNDSSNVVVLSGEYEDGTTFNLSAAGAI